MNVFRLDFNRVPLEDEDYKMEDGGLVRVDMYQCCKLKHIFDKSNYAAS